MMKFLHLPPLFPVNRNLIALLCCLFFLCSVPQAGADTTVGGTISTDTIWTASASPYIVASNITVQGTDGADDITTLTIEPGVVVKLNKYRIITIGAYTGDPGALVAQGTAENPILFTSNQSIPAPGDWYYLRFDSTAHDATTIMEHCVVEYGGYSNGSLYVNQAAPTLRSVTIQNSKTYGAFLNSSEPTIENCTFSGNQNYDLYYAGTAGGSVTGSTINNGIYLLVNGTVNFFGNTINQNNVFPIKAYADYIGEISASTFNNVDTASYMEVNGSTISRDATWTAAIPYVIKTNFTVQGTDGADDITTLTIEPGVVVKLNKYRIITIGAYTGDPGALVAQGTAENPILFTSNQSSPVPGDWYYIRFDSTAAAATTIMEYCVVEYGGYNSGALYLNQAAPTIQNSTIRNSKTAGIYANVSDASTALIECNTFFGNQNGIYWNSSPPPDIHGNNFSGNTSYGLNYRGSQILNAEDNWWGDTAGPNTGGDAIYGNVDAEPWSLSEHQCASNTENYPPFAPTDPAPAPGEVRISTENGVQLNWTCSDPNTGDTLTYDLYWGITPDSLQIQAQDLAQATHTMTDVLQGTFYIPYVNTKNKTYYFV